MPRFSSARFKASTFESQTLRSPPSIFLIVGTLTPASRASSSCDMDRRRRAALSMLGSPLIPARCRGGLSCQQFDFKWHHRISHVCDIVYFPAT